MKIIILIICIVCIILLYRLYKYFKYIDKDSPEFYERYNEWKIYELNNFRIVAVKNYDSINKIYYIGVLDKDNVWNYTNIIGEPYLQENHDCIIAAIDNIAATFTLIDMGGINHENQ